MATPRARGVMSLTISSLIRTSPDVCRSRPAMILRKVVLPQPDGPSSTRNSPSQADKLTPSRAATSPKSFLMSLATTAAIWTSSLSRERLKLPSAAGRLELPCPIGINVRRYYGSADVWRGEQLYPPVPLFASVHTADHFL